MPSSSSGANLRMKPQSSSLFSLLFFLLLPRPSLFYSLKNCTIDFDDQSKVLCDHNKLTTIPSDIPKSATYLSLFDNDIMRIRQTDLKGFTRLQSLHLGSNDISQIEDGAFSDLSALTWLLLTFNKLTDLTDNMFKGLSNLSSLYLGANKIKSISKFAFEPLNNLQELDLSGNNLVQISDITNIVSHCPSLKILNLGSNEFTSFESELFLFPLLNLTELDLSSTPLRKFSVHSEVFPHLEYLSVSNMKESVIEWDVSDKAFLKSVTSLELSSTKLNLETYQLIFQSVDSVENVYLQNFGRFFDRRLLDFACGILSLQKLDLSNNDISFLNDTLLQSCTTLTELDLHSNSLSDLSESSLRMLTRLSRLNIESNELSRVPLAIRNMCSLTYLSLRSNYIREIQCSDFTNLTLLTELNLKSNRISKLSSCVFKDLQNLKVLNVQNNLISYITDSFCFNLDNLVTLNVNGNNIGWLQKRTFKNLPSLTDLDLNSLSVTTVENGAFEGLLNLKRLTFSPSYKSIWPITGLPQLEKLVMFLFYKEMTELTNNELLVSLPSLQELTMVVDKSICYSGTEAFLKGFGNLKILSFHKYCCDTLDPDTFLSIPYIVNLQFINCQEFSPSPELLQPLTDLKVLDLTHNNMESLDFLVESNLTKLEKLILINNKLTIINETVFEALPSLKYLDLSGNPFVCNCSNAGFIQWAIKNKQVQVVNAFQYRCSSPLSEDGHFLLDFNVQSCWEFPGFLCFISSSALVLFTHLSSFLYHFLRWQLVYGFYLLLAFLYDSKKRRQGCPHIYDAFVSYNVHDEDWVYGELLPELEGEQGWRLCLHHRDFQPGKPIIENITDSIYSSRKTLCVISRRYLQSEWCSREIQMASFRLFDEQKDVLILLFLEEISSNQLSPFYRMRKLVKSRTYLSWTQARSHKGLFWEKVRRALESGNEPGDNHNPLTANI